jgi:hypothetical protein
MPVNIALRCHSNYSVGPAVGSGVSTIVVAERPGRRPSSSKI